jgi:radical SAM superfamily enzyme YgiQ (UPF0313 family)
MKVNLIIPPNPFLGDEKRNPPLGLLYVAATTRNAGHEVSVTDLRGEHKENMLKYISPNADIYGFTAATPDYHYASGLAKEIKSQNPQALTVIGGIHATSLPEKIGYEFDKVVIGEGENSFLQILEDEMGVQNPYKRFYKSNRIINLDLIPFPARDLIPRDSAFSPNAFSVGGEPTATIITSRGCPGECSFCGSKEIWGRKIKFRGVENVVQEIEEIIDNYGVNYFKFYDDTMVLGGKRLERLCNSIKPMGIHWKAATRADYSDLDKLRLMKESGCEEIAIGVESLDQETLDRNQKGITIKQVYRAIENMKDAGLEVRTYFIIGLPGEKPGYSRRLEKFISDTNPDAVDLSTYVIFPGSSIFHNPKKWGVIPKSSNFEEYIMTVGLKEEDSQTLTFVHDILTEEEIIEERRKSLEIIKSRKMVKNL